jgi:hypothetical protein
VRFLLFLLVLFAAVVLGGRWLARNAGGMVPSGFGGRAP